MHSSNWYLTRFLLALAILPFMTLSPTFSHALTQNDAFFSDVTEIAGVPGDTDGARGVCWGDYNNDGMTDMYVSSSYGSNILYRNNGDGTFTDATVSAGVEDDGASNGVAWGDYNNDSWLDLYVANMGGNTLFMNNGDGSFTNVSEEAGVSGSQGNEAVTWVDYDNDGHLDIYVVELSGTNVLYRNNGDGTFSDESSEAGVNDAGSGENAAWADYDNDGFQDLYVSNRDRNSLYHNNGNGTFNDVTVEAGVGDWGSGHGIAWGDYDNDGLLDLYLVNRQSANLLYHNNGDGTFTDMAPAAGVDDSTLYTVGTAFLDFDNDGDLDIFNVSGAIDRLFSNDGDGTFSDVTDSAGVGGYGRLGNGMAWGDYNNNGYVDIYVVNWSDGCVLYENNLRGNNWLQVKLAGRTSNSAGIGARVEVHRGDAVYIQEINGGSGFLSQNSMVLQFGLGQAPVIDCVVVHWQSGYMTSLQDVGVNQLLVIEEPLPVEVELIPDGLEYRPGDTVTFLVILSNNTHHCQIFEGWSEVVLPDSSTIAPLHGPYRVRLFPMSTYEFRTGCVIPFCAPEGEYLFRGLIGTYPDEILDEDSFRIIIENPFSGR